MNHAHDLTFMLFTYRWYQDFLPLCLYSTHLCYPKASFTIVCREQLSERNAQFIKNFARDFKIFVEIWENIDYVGDPDLGPKRYITNDLHERYSLVRFLLPQRMFDQTKRYAIIGDIDVLRLPDGGSLYTCHKAFMEKHSQPCSYVLTKVPNKSPGDRWLEDGISGGAIMIDQHHYWETMSSNIDKFIQRDKVFYGPTKSSPNPRRPQHRCIFHRCIGDQPALYQLLEYEPWGPLHKQEPVGIQGLHLGWARSEVQPPIGFPYKTICPAQREWAMMLFNSDIAQEARHGACHEARICMDRTYQDLSLTYEESLA